MSRFVVLLIVLALAISGCAQERTETSPEAAGVADHNQTDAFPEAPAMKEPPKELPKGVLLHQLPGDSDVIFSSIRYVLNDTACLDDNYELKANFINDPDCNRKIYASDGQLASPLQLFTMDLETGRVDQITNTDCSFVSGQAVNSTTVMVSAVCSDTDGNGRLNLRDQSQLYLLHLESGEMDCLTCGLSLVGINNADYSSASRKIVFSAGTGQGMNNRLFTMDLDKNLVQLTNDSGYLDFDCSWSEDGAKIALSRLPNQKYPLSIPSQAWLMDADGSNQEKITDGGDNPAGEENLGSYPVGIDADPDLSPDNKEIVISRLKSSKQNWGFGIFELIVVDVKTKAVEVLDSQYANMVPEWKEGGILFIRQVGADHRSPMDIKQSLYLYKDGEFKDLEGYPYNVFPLGAYSGTWIKR